MFIGLALALDAMAFGAWYTASRAYIRDVVGDEAYNFIALLVAFESLPYILSPLAGFLGDLHGRRFLAITGGLPRVLLTPLVAFVGLDYMLAIVFSVSLLSVVFYSNLLGLLLWVIKGSGRLYGLVTLAAPLGYGIGSLIPGLLKPLGGYELVFLAIGLIEGLAAISLIPVCEAEGSNRADLRLLYVVARSLPLRLIVAILLSNIALTLFWNVMSIRLYEVTGSILLFGLVGGFLTTLASTVARPLAGLLVDRFGADSILASVLACYMVYNYLIYNATGLVLVMLWLVPLYPFREVSQVMSLSRRVPQNLQGVVAGLLNMLWGLSSLTYPLVYVARLGLEGAFILQILALAVSLALLVWVIVDTT